jgi:hypothetical protein
LDEIGWRCDVSDWGGLLREAENDFWGEGFVAVADDGSDAGHCSEFLGSALGVAAGDYDLRGGIEAVGAADEGARGAVCFCRDAAGVDDDKVGDCGITFSEARSAQAAADCLAIGAGRSASEVFHVEFRHDFSLVPFGCALLYERLLIRASRCEAIIASERR